jgi:hypothetical protein
MTRKEAVEGAMFACQDRIDPVHITFFYRLFKQIFEAGVESTRPVLTGGIAVYDCAGNSILCESPQAVMRKFNYSYDTIKKHLENGLPTPRGHVFKYA